MKTFMKIGNFFIRLILTSPLHRLMSKNTLLVHFTGRKSGGKFTTPVNYTQEGNTIRLTSQRNRVWWRNLKTKPEISMTLRGQKARGKAVVLETPMDAAKGLAKYLRPAPQMAKYFDVKINPVGSFDQSDLFKAADGAVVIEITLH